jgi:copper(I)-binding protein
MIFSGFKNRMSLRWSRPATARITTAIAIVTSFATAFAHEYYAETFQIVHPWTEPAPAGTKRLVLSMEIVDIVADDRLVGGSTPVAKSVQLNVVAIPEGKDAPGAIIRAGQIAKFGPDMTHLVLNDITVDLHWGRQYPLQLVFEKAGTVEAELIIGTH